MSEEEVRNGVPDYLDQPLGEFLDAVASGEPAPGGGAAAAVAVALAAGLSAMAARFSSDCLSEAPELAERAEGLRSEVSPLARADAESYTRVLAALRLPRDDPDRGRRLDETFGEAADVPLSVAGCASGVAGLAARLAEEGNPNLKGDAITSALLAGAGASAAASLVEINATDSDGRRARAAELAGAAASAARRACDRKGADWAPG